MKQQEVRFSEEIKVLNVTSEAFENGTFIPRKYTSEGENINPPLTVKNIPLEAKSLVLTVECLDAPIRPWLNWVVWNIPVSDKIPERSIPGVEGWNDFSKLHYGGPCPHSTTHHYSFKVYALDNLLSLKIASTKDELEKTMRKHIVAYNELIGLYKSEQE